MFKALGSSPSVEKQKTNSTYMVLPEESMRIPALPRVHRKLEDTGLRDFLASVLSSKLPRWTID